MSKTSAWCWGLVKWIGVPLAIGAVGFYFVGPVVLNQSPKLLTEESKPASPTAQALQVDDDATPSTKFKTPPLEVTVGEATMSKRLRPGPVVRRRDRTEVEERPAEPEVTEPLVEDPSMTDPNLEQPIPGEQPEKPKKKKKKRSSDAKPTPKHEEPKHNNEPSPGSSDEAGSGGAATGGGEGDPAGAG